MIRVVVAGASGWVGKALVTAIGAAADLELVGAVARNAAGRDAALVAGQQEPCGVVTVATLREALETPSDVVIDYTKPLVVKGHTLEALAAGRHVVIGTSGLGAEDYAEIAAAAEKAGRGVIAAGNFSITATLLKRFALIAARYVPDFEIIDYASAKKQDSPSGTARELAETLAAIRQKPTSRPVSEVTGIPATRGSAVGTGDGVQVHSLRLPGFVLACETVFALADERLTLRHDAGSSAAPYVGGTLLAARKVITTQGLIRGLDSLID